MEFRDNLIKEMGANLVVGSVQQSIDEGAVVEETGMNASRNALQTTTLLDTIEFNNFDACMGGARRDEEKQELKNASSLTVTISVSGILRTSVQNSGTCSMVKSAWASTSVCSQSLTGQKWTYGSIS